MSKKEITTWYKHGQSKDSIVDLSQPAGVLFIIPGHLSYSVGIPEIQQGLMQDYYTDHLNVMSTA